MHSFRNTENVTQVIYIFYICILTESFAFQSTMSWSRSVCYMANGLLNTVSSVSLILGLVTGCLMPFQHITFS